MSTKPHGGKRKNAGRPKLDEPMEPFSVRLTKDQSAFLSHFGEGDRKQGLRKLIELAIERRDLFR